MDEKGNAQKVRCLNCFTRVEVPANAKMLVCPNCNVKYKIGWRGDQAKIVGTAEESEG